MLDFAHPYYLILLLSIPVVWLLYLLMRMSLRGKLKKFGTNGNLHRLMPDASRYKNALKLSMCLIALAAIVVALARPRHGEKNEISSSAGSEIVIAFDVSRSMLAPSTDDPSSMSRIDRSRMLLEKLVSNLGKDKVGLVVFAANARMQMPLTSDHRIIQMAMKNDLTPGMMSNQGTSISEAIEMATLTFPGLRDEIENGNPKETIDPSGIHRAIILLTDAEDHEGDAVQLAQETAKLGIQIDVIGVGTELGGKIPMGKGLYMRDMNGEEVITSLNAEAASAIAQAGNGVYVNAADPNALETLQNSLNNLKKTEFEKVSYKMSAEQFPLFAWIALIFLILDIIIMERKTSWLKGVDFFNKHLADVRKNIKKSSIKRKKSSKNTTFLSILLCALALSSISCNKEPQQFISNKEERNAVKNGNKEFKRHNFDKAVDLYKEAIEANPNSDKAKYNLGLTLWLSQYADSTDRAYANQLLSDLAKSASDPEVAENALYTLSNINVYVGDELKKQSETEQMQNPELAQQLSQESTQCYKKAISGYEEILRRRPGDLRVTQNLRITQLKLPPEENGDGGSGNNDQNQDQQDQQEQQQQQQQQQQQPQPQADALNALEKREAQTRKRQNEPPTAQGAYRTDKPW